MKKTIVILLITILMTLNTGFAVASGEITHLTDLDNHWIRDNKVDLYLLQHLGIFQGYADGTFKPRNQITREEFTKILIVALAEGVEQDVKISSFQDVIKDKNWSFDFVEKAVAKGILIPSEYQHKFSPKTPITRQEMAVMIARALGATQDTIIDKTIFLDDAEIPLGVKSYIQLASEKGIITGYTTPTGAEFRPKQTATRAEAALMLVRFLDQKNQLKKTAFYAIDSYKQMSLTKNFHEIVYGWSALEETVDGGVAFTMKSKESLHKLPQNHQEPLNYATSLGVDRKLMVTDTRTKLIYSLLDNKENQAMVIQSILNNLKEYGFTGIVMDLENIRNGEKGYRNAYTEFLRDLKVALIPHNYTLAVAVQPRNVVGYFDGYDFAAIGNIADEVILMAHDYHDSRNTNLLTDHAPFRKVHGALKDMLDTGVKPEKIILGLQMAGGTQIRRTDDGARTFYTPPFSGIYRALEERKGTLTIDFITMTPQFHYLDDVNKHENWIRFENKESIQSKMRLAKFYGIKGISIWRMGEIPEEILHLIQ